MQGPQVTASSEPVCGSRLSLASLPPADLGPARPLSHSQESLVAAIIGSLRSDRVRPAQRLGGAAGRLRRTVPSRYSRAAGPGLGPSH